MGTNISNEKSQQQCEENKEGKTGYEAGGAQQKPHGQKKPVEQKKVSGQQESCEHEPESKSMKGESGRCSQ